MSCSRATPRPRAASIENWDEGQALVKATPLKIVINGAAGRMGRTLIRQTLATSGAALAGGLERAAHPDVGRDLGPLGGLDSLGLVVETDPAAALRRADVVIDFSAPAASLALARAAADAGIALVIGTTGFSASEDAEIAALAKRVAVVKSGNMSLGVNLLANLVREAARRLGPDYDIEIVEAHHRAKVDAPSGTALMLGAAAAGGRGIDLGVNAIRGRDGLSGERSRGAIGFASVRGGGIVGDHEVMFAGEGEVIALAHRAIDRGLFAKGALTAAMWSAGKPAGLYGMADVLGFKQSL
jgi:4-hydroxy-tetrahydrodipicolinate reductase